jgi:hypothetical protein
MSSNVGVKPGRIWFVGSVLLGLMAGSFDALEG